MSDEILRELEKLWSEHGDRRFPPIVEGDAEALDLRHDIIAYDSRVASGVLAVLEGDEPLHPRRFEPEEGLLERIRAWAASRPNVAPAIFAEYVEYVAALDRLGDIAGRVWAIRRGPGE